MVGFGNNKFIFVFIDFSSSVFRNVYRWGQSVIQETLVRGSPGRGQGRGGSHPMIIGVRVVTPRKFFDN